MLKPALIELFTRDLNLVKDEISKYENEPDLWVVRGAVTNSAGNLCLHLIGNINHFFGAVLSKNGFVRDRASEFASRDVARETLLKGLDGAIEVMRSAVARLSDDEIAAAFPEQHRGREVTTLQMLLHLSTHLNYHLGQINYHRRMIEG